MSQLAMRSHWFCWSAVGLLAFALIACSSEPPLPYDAEADPRAELKEATQLVNEDGRGLLLVFGANWCPDCRRLHDAMLNPSIQAIVEKNFVVIQVDIGNWDHNLDFVDAWGDPIAGGIPAVVVANAQHEVLYATKGGELATARNMGESELKRVFEGLAERVSQSDGP